MTEELFMEKYKIEMIREYKFLAPMDRNAVEAAINSYAIDGWQVLVFNHTPESKFYALCSRKNRKN